MSTKPRNNRHDLPTPSAKAERPRPQVQGENQGFLPAPVSSAADNPRNAPAFSLCPTACDPTPSGGKRRPAPAGGVHDDAPPNAIEAIEAAEKNKNPQRPYRQGRRPGRICARSLLGNNLSGWGGKAPPSYRAEAERAAAFGHQASALASLSNSGKGDIE